MKKIGLLILFCFALTSVSAQFTFECFCGYLTAADSNCDVCTSGQQSRYFKGLLIRKDGVVHKWIEQPYTILQNFDALTFKELIHGAEQIRITLAGTPFDSIQQFRDSVMCPCSGGAGVLVIEAGPGISIYGDTIASIPQQIDTFDLVSGTADTIRISLSRDSVPFHFVILPNPDGTETIVTAGTGISVTGDGSVGNPYVVTNTGDPSSTNEAWTIDAVDGDTELITDQTVLFSGTGIVNTSYDSSSNSLIIYGIPPDGSETIVTGTNGITVTGTGTSGTPYVVGMPAATNTQTLRYNGTDWLANSLLTNDGSNLGVNSAPSSAALIRIKQAGNTDGIELERDTDTRKLQIYQDGNATIQSTSGNLDIKATSGTLTFFGPGGGGFVNQTDIRAQSNITSVFGNSALLRLSATYAPTTSGGDFAFYKFLPTINQSGAANQDVFMIDFNPTLTSVTGTLYGIRYNSTIGRAFWQPNGAGTVINHFAGNTGIGSGSTAPAQTLHVEGTARITGSDGTPTTLVGRDDDGDISALGLSGLSIVSGTLTVTADGDGSPTNEGILGVAAGGANDALLTSNTSGANGVTYEGGTGIAVSETTSSNGGTITITNTGDLSATNELQTLANTSDATSHTVTLSNSGGSIQVVEGTGITLATTGTGLDGILTISAATGLDSNGIYTGSNFVPTNVTATLTDRLRFLSATDDSGGWAPVEIDVLAGNEPDILKFKVTQGAQVDSLVWGYGDQEFTATPTLPLALYVPNRLYVQTDSMLLTGIPNATVSDTFALVWGTNNVIRKKPLSDLLGGLNGIYGDGTTGSGSDILPPGGSNVEIPGQYQPLSFELNTASGQSWTALYVTTPYSQDDAFSRYLVGKAPADSLQIYSYDGGTTIREEGGVMTISGDQTAFLTFDSLNVSTIPTNTVLPFVVGVTASGWVNKIEGTTTGQTLIWDEPNGYWELGTAGGGGPTGTGTANRITYWTGASTLAADDDFAFDGTTVGIGTTTLTPAKLNINAGTSFTPMAFNAYGTASSSGGIVYGILSNTLNTSSVVFSLNEESTSFGTLRAGLRKFGSSHATRPNELNLTTFVASAPVTIGTNDAVRMTVAADGTVHAHNNLAAGFTSTTGIHSTLQSAGSFGTAFLETVGAPTFNATLRTVVYTASTNISWTLQTPGACACPGRELILHHAGSAGTITLSQTITKGNTGNFNTLSAGQWAYIIYTSSGIRGYKLTSL